MWLAVLAAVWMLHAALQVLVLLFAVVLHGVVTVLAVAAGIAFLIWLLRR
jgi:hypothetical protein